MKLVDKYSMDMWHETSAYSVRGAVDIELKVSRMLEILFIRLLEQMPDDIILKTLGERWEKAE